jgi:hypothetical protein
MKKILELKCLLVCAVTLLISISAWSQTCYNVVGYFPSWQGAASAIDYSKYSHINYSFGIPNTNGTIGAIENSAKLVDLVSRGHAANTKVLLAVGGWLSTSPSSTPFESISTNSTAITQFVNSCANLVTQYNLDGIDVDWEYPTTQARWNALIVPLANRLHSMGKLVTAAVPAGAYFGNGIGNVAVLDLVNIMSYDCACPTVAPYSQAVDALNYWAGRGVPQNKRVLGVPFYSSDNTTSLHVQKANLAKSNASGIMIWEISTYGDINAIVSTLGAVCKGGVPPVCSTVNLPGTIQAESYCTMSGVQTETTTDTGGGQNVGYIDTNDWMSYRINVPSTGTYTVQYRVASLSGGGSIRLEPLGGGTAYGTLAVPSTGGWQTWTTISHTITLAAGQRDIAIAVAAGGFNINWLSITGGGSGSPNRALNRPVTVSSTENATHVSSRAVDGNGTTRWSSAYSDPQWIYVDLGATYNVNRVKITWEAAYGRNYYIESSPNASTWTNLKTITNNTALVNDHTGLSRSARYIRIYGTTRGTAYGYSIFELEVYGTAGARMGGEEILSDEVEQTLVNAYPNPTSGKTTIAVNLPTAGHAVINVSGSMGNKIAELHNGHLNAGVHEFDLNTDNVAPGLILYSITFKGKKVTKKLIKQ